RSTRFLQPVTAHDLGVQDAGDEEEDGEQREAGDLPHPFLFLTCTGYGGAITNCFCQRICRYN
ncbi:hypothetical protein A2U01_0097543, partial [Trifolium medium]|nr:hypothetical protein [Trifolium medium]